MLLFKDQTSSAKSKIQSRFAKISFIVTCTGTIVADTAIANMAATTMALTHQTQNGTNQVIFEQKLIDLLEIATHNEGAVNVSNNGTDSFIKGAVEITDVNYRGSIAPSQGDFFELSVNNVPNGVKVTAYIIEFAGVARLRYDYNPVAIQGGAPAPVSIAGAKNIAVDSSKLTQIELIYGDNSKLVLLPDEVNQLMIDWNHTAYNKNGLVTAGGGRLFVIDVEKAVQANVTYSSAGNVVVVNVKGAF